MRLPKLFYTRKEYQLVESLWQNASERSQHFFRENQELRSRLGLPVWRVASGLLDGERVCEPVEISDPASPCSCGGTDSS